MARTASRTREPLAHDGAVAHLHHILGLEPRFLFPYALPSGIPYDPAPYLRALEKAKAPALRGRLLRLLERRDEALDAFGRAQDVDALAWRGELLVTTEGRAREGFADLDAASRRAPKDPRPKLWTAAAILESSANPDAFRALDSVLAADQRNLRALLMRAAGNERLSKLEPALKDLVEAAKIAPDCAGAWIMRGRVEARLGRAKEASASFAAACRLEPDAKNFYAALLKDESMPTLDAFIRENPKAAFAWALRGDLKRSVSRGKSSGTEDLVEAARLDPKSPWIRACLARSRVQGQNDGAIVDEGIEDLETAIALDPSCHWLYQWLGEAFRQAGRQDDALKAMKKAMTLRRDFAQSRLWLGRVLSDKGRHEEGVVEFSRAAAADPGYGFAYAKRGEALAKLGRHLEAVQDFDRALNLTYPCRTEWILEQRARCRLAVGDYGGAFDDYARLVRSNPRGSRLALEPGRKPASPAETLAAATGAGAAIYQDPGKSWPHAWRGALRLALGEQELGLRDLDRAVCAQPAFAWAFAWRGRALWLAGRSEDGLKDLDEALRRDAATAWVWSWRAEALLGAGRGKDALADAERALELSPQLGHAHYCRGEALRQLGRVDEAAKSLDAAVAAEPDLAQAYISRGMLAGERGDVQGQLSEFRRAAQEAPELFKKRLEEAKAAGAADVEKLIESILNG